MALCKLIYNYYYNADEVCQLLLHPECDVFPIQNKFSSSFAAGVSCVGRSAQEQ